MYTYTVPFAVRSDSANHLEEKKKQTEPADLCGSTDLQRHSYYQVHRYLLTRKDTCILFHSALGQRHTQVFC